MSDPTEDTYANRPVAAPISGELLEIPAAQGWVVHELLRARSGLPTVWAWCRVAEDQPGYSHIVYTLADGVTQADPGPNPTLGPVVVKVFC